jgi:hypothetical protein
MFIYQQMKKNVDVINKLLAILMALFVCRVKPAAFFFVLPKIEHVPE